MILLRKANLQLIVDAAEAKANWDKMATHTDAGVSAEATKAEIIFVKAEAKADKFANKKIDFDKLKLKATEQLNRLEKTGEFSSDKVSGALKFARDHEDTANFLFSAITTLAKSGNKIGKAMKA